MLCTLIATALVASYTSYSIGYNNCKNNEVKLSIMPGGSMVNNRQAYLEGNATGYLQGYQDGLKAQNGTG